MTSGMSIQERARPASPGVMKRRVLPTTGGGAASPPPTLPLSHFAFALLWLAVASVMLPWVAPHLARGNVFEPAVIALVHVLVLGTVGSAIAGALQQFVPGALGVPLRSVRVGWFGLWLHQAGVLSLVTGMTLWRGWIQGVGWLLVLGGVACVSINVLRARRRSVHGKHVALFITVGHSALGLGMAIGAARIGETLGWWHLDRMSLIATHALLGAAGFGTLTAMGVGSRMIPTFLGALGDDRRWLNAVLASITSGLAVFTIGALGGWAWATHLGGALLALGGATCVTIATRWFRRRSRPMDETAWHVAAAFAALSCGVMLGIQLLLGDPLILTRWAALLVTVIVGWLVTLTVGVQSKIASHLGIPLYRRLFGEQFAPTPPDLRAARVIVLSLALQTSGWLSLAVALLLRSATGARAGAAIWGLGAVTASAAPAWVLARAWRRARVSRAELHAQLARR